MFGATVHTLVKALGSESLIGVESLVSSNNAKVLQVVVKKNKRFIFQKPKYFSTEFQLHQILKENCDLNIPTKKSPLVEYEQDKQYDVKGELGASICKEIVEASIDIDDTVKLTAKCGSIAKEEVDVPGVMISLNNKHLDFHHPLVKQVREDPRRVLCVITEVVYLENEGTLHSKLETKKTASLKANVNPKTLDVTASGEYDSERDKAFKIPAGTPLAYAVCELTITKTGRIELVVVDGAKGGFGAFDDAEDSTDNAEVDITHNRLSDLPVTEMFSGFISLTSQERDNVRHMLTNIMAQTRLIKPLYRQVKKSYKVIDGTVAKTTTIDTLRSDISADSSDWKPFLSFVGFTFASSGEVTYPSELSDLLDSSRCILEALRELDDDVIKLLRRCNHSTGPALVALIRTSLYSSNPINIDRPGLSPILECTDLLKELKYDFMDTNVVIPPSSDSTMQAVYHVSYALWGS